MEAVSLLWSAVALLAAGSLVTVWIAERLPADVLARAGEGRYAGLGADQAQGDEHAPIALPATGMLNTSR